MGRLLLTICGVVMALGLMGASPEAQKPKGNSNQDEAAAGDAGDDVTPGSLVTVVIPQPDVDPGCDENEDRRESDLCAQWKAANAAKDASNFAGVALIVSVAGTLFLLLTFSDTRDTSRRQIRAYVDISNPKFKRPKKQPDLHSALWVLRFHVHNFGETPAFDVLINSRSHRRLKEDVVLLDEAADDEKFGGVSRGDFIDYRFPIVMTEGDEARIRTGDLLPWFEIKISYRDAFGKRHHTSTILDLTKDMKLTTRDGSHMMT